MRSDRSDHVILRLVKFAKPIALWLLLGGIIDILSVCSAVAIPDIMGDLFQLLYDRWESGMVKDVCRQVLPGALRLLGAYAMYAALNYLNMLLMNKVVSRHFTCNIRIRISEKLAKLPVKYVDQTPVGDILARMTGDVSEVGNFVHQIFDLVVKGVFQLLLIAVAMFMENWRLALFVVLMMPLSVLLSSKVASASEKHYDDYFKSSGALTEMVEEAFSNYPTTKAYNLEDYSCRKHEKLNRELQSISVRADMMGSIVQPVIKLFNATAFILINLFGGYLIVTGNAPVGMIVTIVLYARQFSAPLEQLAYGFTQINRVKASARRIFEILDMEEEREATGRLTQAPKGQVEFQNVDFSYDPKKPLIRDLSFTAFPGQRIAIVGPTGAGKTTVVNLLMRFYKPQGGKILLDGLDASTLSGDEVRRCFGMVLQDTWLFRGTIAENVAYGKPDATLEEIREACRRAHCDHFIRTLPQGYDTVIGEDTVNLSSGQRQLLTIARAMLANRPLLILDEATSNVDTRTEVKIQEAMEELMQGRTSFVIAHRLSTIVSADLILVMDHGKIVEQGTHRELLKQKGFYYQMYSSQYAV